MWAWLTSLVARPMLRMGLAVFVTWLLSNVAASGVLNLAERFAVWAWPHVLTLLKHLLRWAARLALASLFTLFIYDLVLRQDEWLDQGASALLALFMDSGYTLQHAVCHYRRVPRFLCPSPSSSTPETAPVVIIVNAPPPPQSGDSRIPV